MGVDAPDAVDDWVLVEAGVPVIVPDRVRTCDSDWENVRACDPLPPWDSVWLGLDEKDWEGVADCDPDVACDSVAVAEDVIA